MKNKLQKLNVIFGVLILVSILFIGAGVAGTVDSGSCGDNLTWVLTDDGTLMISGTGAMYDYDNLDNLAPWRQYCSQMKSLVLPDGLTTIGNFAFLNCMNFTGSLTIPNSVTTIGDEAFAGCSGFTGPLLLPNNITIIGGFAFHSCSGFTGDLVIPVNMTTIEWASFYNCSGFNGSLILPANLTTIKDSAFMYCSGFNGSLILPDNLTTIERWAFVACNGFNGSLVIPKKVTVIGEGVFHECKGISNVVIPNSVTVIGTAAFSSCNNLTTISVESMNPYYLSDEQGILYNKDKTLIVSCPAGKTGPLTIPNSVKIIGSSAFSECSGLTGSLTIPNSVTTIGAQAFNGCSGFTGSLIIPNSVTTIGAQAFNRCSGFTGSLTISNNVHSIEQDTFLYCTGFNGSLILPSNLTMIGQQAFFGCSGFTGSLIIPSNVTTIGGSAFVRCSGLTSVTIPSNVTRIDPWGFCYLHSNSIIYCECPVSLLSSMYSKDKTILAANGTNYAYTFTVDSTTFPSGFSLTNDNTPVEEGKIFNGWYANPEYSGDKVTKVFDGQTLYAKWTEPAVIDSGSCGSNLNWVLTEDGTLKISGTGSMNNYKLFGAPWYRYKSQITKLVLLNGITTIGENAFYDCNNIVGKLNLPNSIITINASAFSGCSGFTGILEIPKNITTIKAGAFNRCSGLSGSLDISANVTTIENYAFCWCTNLTSINIDTNNPNYSSDEQGIFYNKEKSIIHVCPGGKSGSVGIPSTVNTIDNYAFQGCSGLTSITIPSSVKTIGASAFDCCSGLTSMTIPSTVKTIGGSAFEGCSGLTSITIPSSVKTIGIAAFRFCSQLTEIVVNSENPNYSSDDQGILYNKDKTTLIACPGGKTGSLVIPLSVNTIDSCAFYDCNKLTGTLVIPSNVTTIKLAAFSGCSGFTGSLVLPTNLTTLDGNAFYRCTGFTGTLVIPEKISTLGWNTFQECSGLTTVILPSNITTIGSSAFFRCNGITNITIPANVTNIGSGAFFDIQSNSIVYSECNTSSFSSSWYSIYRTALAEKKDNNTYNFTVSEYLYPSGFILTDENAPISDRYSFAGWYTNPVYFGEKITTVFNGQTLYAKWSGEPGKIFTNNSGMIVLDPGYSVTKINVSNTSIGNISFAYDQNVSAPTRIGYQDQKAFGEAFNITLIDGSFNGGKAKIFFNISKSDLGTRDTSNIILAHFYNGTWEYLTTVKESEDSVNVQFSAETTSFSPFYPMYMVPVSSQLDYSSSSSRQSGGSYILPEGDVAPTVTPTAVSTQASERQVVNPTANPTTQPTQQSPTPLAGLIAGLGAVALLLNRLRR